MNEIDIEGPGQLYRGWFRSKRFRCRGRGWFFDGVYGHCETISYAMGFWFSLQQAWHDFWRFAIRRRLYEFKVLGFNPRNRR